MIKIVIASNRDINLTRLILPEFLEKSSENILKNSCFANI